MLKRIFITISIIIALFVISYTIHNSFNTGTLRFSLLSIYLFHLISTIITYTVVELLFEKLPNQVGYAYLMLMCFKIGAFILIFKNTVFAEIKLEMFEKLSLVIPLFIFLIAEAIFVGKLLSSK